MLPRPTGGGRVPEEPHAPLLQSLVARPDVVGAGRKYRRPVRAADHGLLVFLLGLLHRRSHKSAPHPQPPTGPGCANTLRGAPIMVRGSTTLKTHGCMKHGQDRGLAPW